MTEALANSHWRLRFRVIPHRSNERVQANRTKSVNAGITAVTNMHTSATRSLYNPEFEHDACGVGFVANISGKSEHRILAYAVQALCHLAHRGASTPTPTPAMAAEC